MAAGDVPSGGPRVPSRSDAGAPRLTDSAAGAVVRALPLLPAPRREPRRSRGSLKCPLQDVAGVGTRSLGKTPPCSGLREGRPPRTAGPAPRLAVRDLGLRPARCHASEVTSVETERLLLPPPEAPRSTGPGLPSGQLHTCRENGGRRIRSREQVERTSRDAAARAPREAHRPPRPPQS